MVAEGGEPAKSWLGSKDRIDIGHDVKALPWLKAVSQQTNPSMMVDIAAHNSVMSKFHGERGRSSGTCFAISPLRVV